MASSATPTKVRAWAIATIEIVVDCVGDRVCVWERKRILVFGMWSNWCSYCVLTVFLLDEAAFSKSVISPMSKYI